MTVSTLAIVLGLGYALPHLFGLMKPAEYRDWVRGLPRSESWGTGLMLLATVWFLWNLHRENISDFASFKPLLMGGFAAVGLGACVYLRDYLAVRGMAVLFMLVAKLMLDTARWAESEWRVLLAAWAYGLVVAGMWLTIAPWRWREWVGWWTEGDRRLRIGCGVRLAFGLGVFGLGLTVFRGGGG
jgi:hypothetical protein